MTDGAPTRQGPSFPPDRAVVLGHSVVALAEEDGRPTGYLAYDRGRGYGPGSQLQVADLVAQTPRGAAALLRSLASWGSVAGTVRWRGGRQALGLLLGARLPPPVQSRPWMLRVLDAPAAVAARGFDPGLRASAAFTLVDPDVPEHQGAWQLTVEAGQGRLARTEPGPPALHVRGLALLYAGVANPGSLRRAGLLEADVPGLAAFGSAAPELVDHF